MTAAGCSVLVCQATKALQQHLNCQVQVAMGSRIHLHKSQLASKAHLFRLVYVFTCSFRLRVSKHQCMLRCTMPLCAITNSKPTCCSFCCASLASGLIRSRWLLIFCRRLMAGSIRQLGHTILQDSSSSSSHYRTQETFSSVVVPALYRSSQNDTYPEQHTWSLS